MVLLTWPYGVDEVCRLAEAQGAQLLLLPGDVHPDPALLARSTVSPEMWQALLSLLSGGGPDNMDRALAALMALADGHALPETAPSAFPEAGLWWPGAGLIDETRLERLHDGSAFVPILFYRAVLEGAGTGTLEALIAALTASGLAPVPVMVSSLKQAGSIALAKSAFARFPPAAILNLTGFALGLNALGTDDNPFADTDAPVIQLVQSGRAEAQWRDDVQGLSPKDLAMQVVLPEIDGRIGGLIVGHKAQSVWHEPTECPLAAYAPDEEGIARAVELAGNYARLRSTPRAERRVALVLARLPDPPTAVWPMASVMTRRNRRSRS